jgi:hypothetical protein
LPGVKRLRIWGEKAQQKPVVTTQKNRKAVIWQDKELLNNNFYSCQAPRNTPLWSNLPLPPPPPTAAKSQKEPRSPLLRLKSAPTGLVRIVSEKGGIWTPPQWAE